MALPPIGRRSFLTGLLAAGFVPQPTWADAGSPAFLAAAVQPDGTFDLCGIGEDLNIRFKIPLPARGHAAAAHPTRPMAVAFARRPGTFAMVIDCVTGMQTAMLNAPEGRHFYGHGVFSQDGDLLFTTENDYEAGQGRIGVWDARHHFQRLDEWDSGGVGPHDIKRLPGSDMLVVANGGIDTHPDMGRSKLNIPMMHPNLSYVAAGQFLEMTALPPEMHKNSIRHLAVSARGAVAFGMQWQGDGPSPTLVGIHNRGTQISLLDQSGDTFRHLQGYIGSIAYHADGTQIAVTSPRGGMLHIYDTQSQQLSHTFAIPDVSGVAAAQDGFIVSSGAGELQRVLSTGDVKPTRAGLAWDNHLVAL